MGWKFLTKLIARFRSSSTSPPPLDGSPPDVYLCMVSGFLMADPVIIPTGDSFDRACVEASLELDYVPDVDLDPSSLVPNLSLEDAISSWCNRVCHRPPYPVSQADARCFIQKLMEDDARAEAGDQEVPPDASAGESSQSRTAGGDGSRPSASDPISGDARLEKSSWAKLTKPQVPASALDDLLRLARTTEGGAVSLCTERILAAVVPMMWPDDRSSLQANASEVICYFSTESANRIKIVGCGAVPPLLHLLADGNTGLLARINAAITMHELAKEGGNRPVIGVMGAIPPLLEMFLARGSMGDLRKESAEALYELTFCAHNLKLLAKTRAVPRILEIVKDRSSNEAIELRGCGVRLLWKLAGEIQSMEDLMDSGAVELMVRLAGEGESISRHCLAVLSEISDGSPRRFKTLALAAGAAQVFAAPMPRWYADGRQLADEMLKGLHTVSPTRSPTARYRRAHKPGLLRITEGELLE